jgi:hypothetical protein
LLCPWLACWCHGLWWCVKNTFGILVLFNSNSDISRMLFVLLSFNQNTLTFWTEISCFLLSNIQINLLSLIICIHYIPYTLEMGW